MTTATTLQKTLPARYYTDPEVFRQELERFFCSMWFCSGRTEQLQKPGDFYLCEVAGESIIVTRDANSAIRAFYNVCRHRGTRMCTETAGSFAGRIQCPYHGWTYGLDGKLIGAPHMEQEGFRREEYPLHSVRVEEWGGFIFLSLDRNAPPLNAQLADLPAKFAPWSMRDLRLYKRKTYEVRANWKLIITNYNECLHCPVLHPALSRVSDYLSGENDTPQPTYIGGSMEFRGQAETMSVDGQMRRNYLPGLNEAQRKLVLYYAVYPNLLLSLHPDYVMAHTLWPQAVDRTHVVCEWYFNPTRWRGLGLVLTMRSSSGMSRIARIGESRSCRRKESVRERTFQGLTVRRKGCRRLLTGWCWSGRAESS